MDLGDVEEDLLFMKGVIVSSGAPRDLEAGMKRRETGCYDRQLRTVRCTNMKRIVFTSPLFCWENQWIKTQEHHSYPT